MFVMFLEVFLHVFCHGGMKFVRGSVLVKGMCDLMFTSTFVSRRYKTDVARVIDMHLVHTMKPIAMPILGLVCTALLKFCDGKKNVTENKS